MLVGKYINGYWQMQPYIPPGWSRWLAIDPVVYSNFFVIDGSTGSESGTGRRTGRFAQYITDYQRDQVLKFLDEVGSEPFFVFMPTEAPHTPSTPAPVDTALFSDYLYRGRGYGETDLSDKPRWFREPRNLPSQTPPTDEAIRKQLRSLQAVDRAVGAIVDKLEQQGKLNNTIIVYASDNGEMWGEHGLSQKGLPYEEAIRVPLIVVYPGVAPRTDAHLVAMDLDVGALLLDLAGIPAYTDGLSLRRLLSNPTTDWRNELIIEDWGSHEAAFGTWAAIRTQDWKYIILPTGEKQLYDLINDPFELQSRHNDLTVAGVMADLSTTLEQEKGLAMRVFTAPIGRVGRQYSLRLNGWGGQPPYHWSIVKGQLPSGLTLNASVGTVTGIPTTAEVQNVSIKVEDFSVSPYSGRPPRWVELFVFEIRP